MKYPFIILTLIFSLQNFSQTLNRDSLWNVWKNPAASDSIRFKAICETYLDAYTNKSADSAFYFVQLMHEFAVKKRNRKLEASALNMLAQFFDNKKGNYVKAMEYATAGLKISEQLKDTDGIANSFFRIAEIYHNQGKHQKAIENYTTSLLFYSNKGNEAKTSLVMISLADLYILIGEYAKSIDLYTRSLKIVEKIGDKYGLARALNGIAMVYRLQGKDAKAIDNYYKVLSICETIGNKYGIAIALNNIGTMYQKQNDLAQALKVYLRSYDISKQIGHKSLEASALSNIGGVYTSKKEFKKALDYLTKSLTLREAISKENDAVYTLIEIGNVYEAEGTILKAEVCYRRGLKISETTNFKDGIAICLIKLGEIYQSQNDLKNAIGYTQKGFKIARDCGMQERAMQAGSILYKLYKASGNFKEALNMHEFYTEKKDSVTSITNIREVARQEIKYNYEKEKLLTRKKHEEQIAIVKAKEEKQIIIIYAIAGILALTFVIMFFVLNRIKLKRKQDQLITEKNLSDYKLTALRAQMNPHFIFNVLNCIQYFISENDQKSAYNSMNMFSRLIRSVLENSDKNTITLSSEIQMLSLYVELETIRFENKFEYNLEIDDAIEVQRIQIPSFLIQPYIENAIIHGLANKKEGGKLRVHLKKQDDARLHCLIEDNGIGRARAREIKNAKLVQDKSLGMSITNKRLGILNNNISGFAVTDLMDASNLPNGTRIEIMIPYIYSAN